LNRFICVKFDLAWTSNLLYDRLMLLATKKIVFQFLE